jgi:hypothetical protein
MATIRVDTSVLLDNSQKISNSSATMASVSSNLNRYANSAPSYDGQFASQVNSIIAGATSQSSQLSTSLTSFSSRLKNKAEEFLNADNTSALSLISQYVSISWMSSLIGFFSKSISLPLISLIKKIFPKSAGWPNQVNGNQTDQPDQSPKNPPDEVISPKSPQIPLGSLSQKYESNGDPGRVSSGVGDIGGVSYGAYQMTSSGGGTVSRFLKSEAGSPWASEFAGLVPGTKEFSEKWKEIALRDPEKFLAAQHEYIKQTHYDPLVQGVKEIGLDVANRSSALQNVIWSTSVQHGGNTNIVELALKGKNPETMSDKDIIEAIYAERGRTNPDGTLVHFGSSSLAVQKGVANRFKNELNDALKMLSSE